LGVREKPLVLGYFADFAEVRLDVIWTLVGKVNGGGDHRVIAGGHHRNPHPLVARVPEVFAGAAT
jgi:hypothetical protein